MITKLELTQRAVDEGYEILKEQLERMLQMAQHKERTTKKSGNGSKRKGSKKLRRASNK